MVDPACVLCVVCGCQGAKSTYETRSATCQVILAQILMFGPSEKYDSSIVRSGI